MRVDLSSLFFGKQASWAESPAVMCVAGLATAGIGLWLLGRGTGFLGSTETVITLRRELYRFVSQDADGGTRQRRDDGYQKLTDERMNELMTKPAQQELGLVKAPDCSEEDDGPVAGFEMVPDSWYYKVCVVQDKPEQRPVPMDIYERAVNLGFGALSLAAGACLLHRGIEALFLNRQ